LEKLVPHYDAGDLFLTRIAKQLPFPNNLFIRPSIRFLKKNRELPPELISKSWLVYGSTISAPSLRKSPLRQAQDPVALFAPIRSSAAILIASWVLPAAVASDDPEGAHRSEKKRKLPRKGDPDIRMLELPALGARRCSPSNAPPLSSFRTSSRRVRPYSFRGPLERKPLSPQLSADPTQIIHKTHRLLATLSKAPAHQIRSCFHPDIDARLGDAATSM